MMKKIDMFVEITVNILIYFSIVRYIFVQKYISLDELNKTIFIVASME